MSIFTPVNQRRHTNIAIVKYKTHGQKFEIACYKNTVVAWRNGIEKDLDEVLQSKRVYTNVGKGHAANKEQLLQCFNSVNEEEICKRILEKGQVQISDLERQAEQDKTKKEIARTVADKCVNPETNRPITMGMIERAINDIHFALNPNKSVKVQAMDLIKQLQKENVMPIQRAQMRIRIVCAPAGADGLEAKLVKFGALMEKKEVKGDAVRMDCLVDPGVFRDVDQLVKDSQAKHEILNLAVSEENDEQLDGDTPASAQAATKASAHMPSLPASSGSVPFPLSFVKAAGTAAAGPAVDPDFDDEAKIIVVDSKPVSASKATKSDGAKFKCNGCSAAFENAADHRDHYKSEWHRFNQRRKVEGKEALTYDDFLEASSHLLDVPKSEFDKLYS